MSDRTPNPARDNLRWESAWWGPHEASASEFVQCSTGTPINAHNRHVLVPTDWAGIVPPHVPLLEAVRQGVAEALDERWIVEPVGDAIVVRRTDLPWWQYRIQQVRGIARVDGPANEPFPFRIHTPGSSLAPSFSALRIDHPIGMLDHRLARDTVCVVTARDMAYNNWNHSFWAPETDDLHNLYVDISGRNGLWSPHRGPTLAEQRRKELAERKPWESKRAFPEGPAHLMAMRAVWAIWVLVDIAERHPRAPKP